MSVRRFLLAIGLAAGMMRVYDSAPSDAARVAVIAAAVVLLLGVFTLFAARPGVASEVEPSADLDDGADSDQELLRGAAIRGASLRSPGGTLVLRRRALSFTHVRGELDLPIERIASIAKGRTLLIFDNQLVLALRDGKREVFQLSENRDAWVGALAELLTARQSAYR